MRTDIKTGALYVGQSKSMSRYGMRQIKHRATPKGRENGYSFEVIRRPMRRNLDRTEEFYIRKFGGPTNKSSKGKLENKRHQMSDKRYKRPWWLR